MTGRSELAGIALAAHDRKQVFKSVAQLLAVIVGKLRNLLQKAVQRLRIVIRNIRIAEDVSEELG